MEPGDIQFDDESGEGGTVTVDRERDLALSAQALAAVEEIDHTLLKLDNGTYGICENCGRMIVKARLEALPYARLVHRLQERGAVETLNTAGEDRPGATGGVISGEARRRARRIRVMVVVALAVLIADQVTKSLAVSRLSSGPIHLIGPFALVLSYNTGVAFSIGTGLTLPIVVIVVVAVAVLAWFGRTVPNTGAAVGVGMILGGAVGNLCRPALPGSPWRGGRLPPFGLLADFQPRRLGDRLWLRRACRSRCGGRLPRDRPPRPTIGPPRPTIGPCRERPRPELGRRDPERALRRTGGPSRRIAVRVHPGTGREAHRCRGSAHFGDRRLRRKPSCPNRRSSRDRPPVAGRGRERRGAGRCAWRGPVPCRLRRPGRDRRGQATGSRRPSRRRPSFGHARRRPLGQLPRACPVAEARLRGERPAGHRAPARQGHLRSCWWSPARPTPTGR